jgi:hypothetical protein
MSMSYIIGLLLLPIGIVIGLNLPDLDSRVSFLVHRSIVTHSFIFPLLLFWGIHKRDLAQLRLPSIGFSLSLAAHLCFDLFPAAWIGYALISVPMYGRTDPLFSWLWIAGSILLCLYLALLLVKNSGDVIVAAASAVVSFGLCAAAESVYWLPLAAFTLAAFVALMLPSSSAGMFRRLLKKFTSRHGDEQWTAEKLEQS